MIEKLTDREIAKYVRSASYPPAKRKVFYDIELKGFCLIVQPSGVMSFALRYRRAPDGKSREYKIGRHGQISAASARKEALRRSGEVRTGKDIQLEKTTAKLLAERDRLQTLRVFFDEKYRPYCEQEMRSGKTQITSIEGQFVEKWPNVPISDLNPFRIQNWRREKMKSGTTAAGVNRPVSALKAMLNRAVEWGVIECNPIASVKPLKEDSGRNVRFLSADEEKRLRKALSARESRKRMERKRYNNWLSERARPVMPEFKDRHFVDYLMPMVLLALNTGMRRGELFNLVMKDVELGFGAKKEGRIVVRGEGAKSGNTRNIPLTRESRDVLERWIKQTKPQGLLFPSPVTGRRIDNINKSWKSLLESAGLREFRFHDLRHTFASKLAMKGVDLYTIKEFLGHSSIETTQRYAHLGPDYKAAAIAILDS